jgi:hypothetical protein
MSTLQQMPANLAVCAAIIGGIFIIGPHNPKGNYGGSNYTPNEFLNQRYLNSSSPFSGSAHK